MTQNEKPWIALAATNDLPIARPPVNHVVKDIADIREIQLPYKTLSTEDIIFWAQQLQGAEGILLRSGYITGEFLEYLPNIKVIAVHGTGVDPVDINACTERKVYVTNTPGANADAVTEITIGLMLSLARQIPTSALQVKQNLAWDTARHTGSELKGKTLGLLGLGEIGKRVAVIAKAFGMNIIGHDPGLTDREIQNRGANSVSFPELAKNSDFLSLHAPAIAATRNIINKEFIAQMKPTSFIINCARGSLVNEVELANALTENHIAGAALDVLDGEPPNPSSPIFNAPNIILTPHMAGSTLECLNTIAATAAGDIVRVLRGESPKNPVNGPF
ncbi:MAG: NAD(P)-dependent oxidoreductase [Alphaproteobacteria bacterium]|nr:NAD(P)-dependent oxidoreductase [Alphaproteobacteria bacterium]